MLGPLQRLLPEAELLVDEAAPPLPEEEELVISPVLAEEASLPEAPAPPHPPPIEDEQAQRAKVESLKRSVEEALLFILG